MIALKKGLKMRMDELKRLWLLLITPLTSSERAVKELESAKRSYLEHKTHAEYYQSLCSFETQRIKRLEQYLEEPSPTPPVSHT